MNYSGINPHLTGNGIRVPLPVTTPTLQIHLPYTIRKLKNGYRITLFSDNKFFKKILKKVLTKHSLFDIIINVD